MATFVNQSAPCHCWDSICCSWCKRWAWTNGHGMFRLTVSWTLPHYLSYVERFHQENPSDYIHQTAVSMQRAAGLCEKDTKGPWADHQINLTECLVAGTHQQAPQSHLAGNDRVPPSQVLSSWSESHSQDYNHSPLGSCVCRGLGKGVKTLVEIHSKQLHNRGLSRL